MVGKVVHVVKVDVAHIWKVTFSGKVRVAIVVETRKG